MFKVGDLVMYANKFDNSKSVQKFFMKPAKVIRVLNNVKYKYEVKLLEEIDDDERSTSFEERELILLPTTKYDLDAMLIREQISEEVYEELISEIKNK